MVNTDDPTGVASFRKLLNRIGEFSFRGNDSDLSRLTELLQRDEKQSCYLSVLGCNPKEHFLVWVNGILDSKDVGQEPKFIPVDKFAIMSAIFECVSKYIDFPYSQFDLDVLLINNMNTSLKLWKRMMMLGSSGNW